MIFISNFSIFGYFFCVVFSLMDRLWFSHFPVVVVVDGGTLSVLPYWALLLFITIMMLIKWITWNFQYFFEKKNIDFFLFFYSLFINPYLYSYFFTLHIFHLMMIIITKIVIKKTLKNLKEICIFSGQILKNFFFLKKKNLKFQNLRII